MRDAVLSTIISAAQRTPLRGCGRYSNLPTEKQRAATLIDKAEAEAREYVRTCGARSACGVEPFQECIDAGNAWAEKQSLARSVEFKLCTQDNIPYESGTFDAVMTFDVLEHVDDPRVSLKEIFRVLTPGANLYAVFPVYRGALSHHPDYLTMIPALHLVFEPERLMRVVNRHLSGRPDIVVTPHEKLSKHFVTGAYFQC